MLVLTVDQVGSSRAADRVGPLLTPSRFPGAVLGPDRTAGDEFQVLFEAPSPALAAALHLLRDGGWSVGLGIGAVRLPLPGTTREATGSAFSSARAAVERAKSAPHRFAVAAEEAPADAADADALVDLLLEVRSRRSAEGWAVADLLADGLSQAEAAIRLGVTPQAVSLRVRAAGLRLERDALPALERLLGTADRAALASRP